jgi:hypothetical protein
MKSTYVIALLFAAILLSGTYLAYSYIKEGGTLANLLAAPIQAVGRGNAGGNGNGNGNNQNQSTPGNQGNQNNSGGSKNSNGSGKYQTSNSTMVDPATLSDLTPKTVDGAIASWLAKPKLKFAPLSDSEARARGLK